MDDFEIVEPVFQRIFGVVWSGGEEDTTTLADLPHDEVAIYATRVLEGELDNGGWYQAFGNGVDHLMEPAISGYELLGLAAYAAHVMDVRKAGFAEDSADEVGEALDAAYIQLSGSEAARAQLISTTGMTG